jgi:hypothetical protein
MASKKIRYDEWVKSIRPDPKDVSDLYVVVSGFIGVSSVSGHVRLYTDEALNNFIEIPENEIVHNIELKDSTLGGSKLWVNSDAVFIYGDPKEKRRPKSSFLQGNLVAKKLSDDGIPTIYQFTAVFGCPTQFSIEVVRCPQPVDTIHGVCDGPPCYKGTGFPVTPQCTSIRPDHCFQTCGATCHPVACTQFEITPTITPRFGIAQRFNKFGGTTGYEGFNPYQGL